jgi:hypothetical protein
MRGPSRNVHQGANTGHRFDAVHATMKFTFQDVKGLIPRMKVRSRTFALRSGLMKNLIVTSVVP